MKRLNEYFCRLTATAFCVTCSTFAILLFANMAHAQENKVPEWKFRTFLEESDFRSVNGDFNRYILDDHDVIQLIVEKVPALRDSVEVVLKLGANVTWWKGIDLTTVVRTTNRGRVTWRATGINSLAAEGTDKGPKSMTFNVSPLDEGFDLSFSKAKTLGAHTVMYIFKIKKANEKCKYAGMRLTFTWERDG